MSLCVHVVAVRTRRSRTLTEVHYLRTDNTVHAVRVTFLSRFNASTDALFRSE